ncbi:MAG: hypothetical protein L6R37_006022 [Teloschistes peruensis]|nr:MAG: hypothetical protein L6R37_006022 [Teloschistes peruensis]
MLFIKALLSVLITFATNLTMAAPTMQRNGTITEGVARYHDPHKSDYGDHLIRVNVFPGDGCTEGPTTFDMAGNEGKECWNYEHGVSIQVSAANWVAAAIPTSLREKIA